MREDTRNTWPSSKIFQSNGILNRDLLNGCWQKNEKKKKWKRKRNDGGVRVTVGSRIKRKIETIYS